MNKLNEIIKIVRDLIDTPEHSENVIDVCDRGEYLIKLLQTEQLILNGVSTSYFFNLISINPIKLIVTDNGK